MNLSSNGAASHQATLLIAELLPALQRLDQRLECATQRAQAADGSEVGTDLYQGLYVDEIEVERLFRQPPGEPLYGLDGDGRQEPLAVLAGSRLAWLQAAYSLSPFDLDVILLALAPELDRRYERIYAYLQNHVSRRWPTVDLALNLLCANAVERLQCRAYFDPNAPLVWHGLIRLLPEQEQSQTALLAHVISLDEQMVRFLLYQDGLDARLLPFCHFAALPSSVHNLACAETACQAMPVLIRQAWAEQNPLRLYLQGADSVGKREIAAGVAAEIDARLLVVDLAQALAARLEVGETLRLVFRYAWFYGVIPYLDGVDALTADQSRHYQPFLRALAQYAGVTMMAGEQPWSPTDHSPMGVLTVHMTIPGFARRRAYWQIHLEQLGYPLAETELNALADRFRLLPTQIAEAAVMAHNQAHWQAAITVKDNPAPTAADFFAAARAQSDHGLATLARKIEPIYTWSDIILPEDALNQLRELCQRVAHRQRVLDDWGFDRKLPLGKGVNVLFAGPSGAGKTMAAEIIANQLGVGLYKIDLSGVVSKYIGETEKNLNRVFAAAASANAILFFDEADALFGKRSEVSDAHDRYANIEISYLLQKMEEYDGVAILATNLRQNLDDAFSRRMAFAIHFPFPDEASRLRIWQGIWPRPTPLADDVDLAFMARQFKLAGGNIKNIALAAAFLAAGEDSSVQMVHLLRATIREYQKLGKTLSDKDFGAYAQQMVPA